MKKVYMLGMLVMLAACFAFAASLSVPWFVDTAAPPTKVPPVAKGMIGLIYLHNNLDEDVTCDILYYSQVGHFLGPVAPAATTFSIPALSTVAFRPVAYDPITAEGGQESAVALLVPDRPTAAPDAYQAGDEMKNGSIVIEWTTGGANDVQGILVQTQTVDTTGAASRLMQWGTLLPPGVASEEVPVP
ncbi:MAG TPA: hypothetical protein VMZ06_17230 [Candidatus Bathyarchaeia archaeon]|nr:hypothetical protein [Candidatus Bathyarchaeia archaeon]